MSVLSETIDRLALRAGDYTFNRVALTLAGPDGLVLDLSPAPAFHRGLALFFRHKQVTLGDLLRADPDNGQSSGRKLGSRRHKKAQAMNRLRERLGPTSPLTVDGYTYRWRGAGERPLPPPAETLRGVKVDFDGRTLGSRRLETRPNAFRLLVVGLLTSDDVITPDEVALAWPNRRVPRGTLPTYVPQVNALLEALGVPETLRRDASGNVTRITRP